MTEDHPHSQFKKWDEVDVPSQCVKFLDGVVKVRKDRREENRKALMDFFGGVVDRILDDFEASPREVGLAQDLQELFGRADESAEEVSCENGEKMTKMVRKLFQLAGKTDKVRLSLHDESLGKASVQLREQSKAQFQELIQKQLQFCSEIPASGQNSVEVPEAMLIDL